MSPPRRLSYKNHMKMTGKKNALNGVEMGCRTRAIKKFLTVKVQTWRGNSAIFVRTESLDSGSGMTELPFSHLGKLYL